jgi:transcription antitermination factor NusG
MPYSSPLTESGLTVTAADGITALSAPNSALAWLAAYTSPRHEKMVARHLEVRSVEHFLPLYKSVRSWKNGCHVAVQFPLFPNYIFVRTEQRLASRLREVPGLLAFVGPARGAIPIPDADIEWLQRDLPQVKFEPHPYLIAGNKYRIVSGPMAGASGILVRKTNGGMRVVLSVDLIRQSVAVEVNGSEIEPF